jgi:hypothetical protein
MLVHDTLFTESIKVKLDFGNCTDVSEEMHLTCYVISPEPAAKNRPFLVLAPEAVPSQNRD